jgi:type IV pilus assembly protein PilP
MRPLPTLDPVSPTVPGTRSSAMRAIFTVLVVSMLVAACGGGSTADLRSYVADVKTRSGTPIEDLPPIEPYVVYTYPCEDASQCNDPFEPFYLEPPGQPESGGQVTGNGISPDFDRNREELENYPLDGLRMMGTLEKDEEFWAIVRDPDSIIHRVQIGNYLGQNNGKITSISEDKVEVLEIVPDGRGGWDERDAEIALAD